jgi:uncharacterized phage-like protein YoqJ
VSESYYVAFTGHRPDKLGGYRRTNFVKASLVVRLKERLQQIRAEHSDLVCISGMALGFDQWAAQACVDLGIPFEAAIPFVGQESRWPADAQADYNVLLAKAARAHVVCGGLYAPEKMQRRNEWMVLHCKHLIAAWNGSSGGTANCVGYAKSIGRSWENLIKETESL